MNEVLEIDLKTQCGLAIEALNAILPIAQKAGIITDYVNAWDEWECLTLAVYMSFIAMPYCDTTELKSYSDFHKLGFEVTGKRAFVQFEFDGDQLVLFDFVEGDTGDVIIEAKYASALDGASAFPKFEECRNFQVAVHGFDREI